MVVPAAPASPFNVTVYCPVPGAGVPEIDGIPGLKVSPVGREPTRVGIPLVSEMSKFPATPAVKLAAFELVNKGVFNTLTVYCLTKPIEPDATGAMLSVNEPVVPAGGVPSR